jgi:hypothetical protein
VDQGAQVCADKHEMVPGLGVQAAGSVTWAMGLPVGFIVVY